jgi:hypothetical protein
MIKSFSMQPMRIQDDFSHMKCQNAIIHTIKSNVNFENVSFREDRRLQKRPFDWGVHKHRDTLFKQYTIADTEELNLD